MLYPVLINAFKCHSVFVHLQGILYSLNATQIVNQAGPRAIFLLALLKYMQIIIQRLQEIKLLTLTNFVDVAFVMKASFKIKGNNITTFASA